MSTPTPPVSPPALDAVFDDFPAINCGPLPELGLIRAAGPEAKSFLQAQLSNDLNQVRAEQAQLSGYCSAKGRLLAVLTVSQLATGPEPGYGLELPAELLAATLKRLRLYVLRSKLSLSDASAELPALAIAGVDAEQRLRRLGLPAPEGLLACARHQDLQISRRAGRWPRFLVRAHPQGLQALQAQLTEAAPLNPAHWRLAELLAGTPVVRSETVEHFVPQTVDLDLAGGISFSKGCYPGQEIVARVHYLGRLKQRLHLAVCASSAPPGTGVHAAGETAQSVGEIMDSAPLPDGQHLLTLMLNLGQTQAQSLHLGAVDGPVLSGLTPAHQPGN